MSSESPEDPFQSPEVIQVSTVKTPGVLGMVGAVIISLLAAGGACCDTGEIRPLKTCV